MQVEDGKLTDYEGTYARFLEKNESEAGKMAVKEQKRKELEKSQIKAKSKVLPPLSLTTCTQPGSHLQCLFPQGLAEGLRGSSITTAVWCERHLDLSRFGP